LSASIDEKRSKGKGGGKGTSISWLMRDIERQSVVDHLAREKKRIERRNSRKGEKVTSLF